MPYSLLDTAYSLLSSIAEPSREYLGSRRNLRTEPARTHGANAKAVAKRRAGNKQADKSRRAQRKR